MSGLLVAMVIAGLVAVAGGVGWIYPPAGVITAGVLMLTAAYVVAYMKARK